jgi:hypothetical protein
VLPGNHWKAWRVLHTSDRWAAWDHGATLGQWLTGPELAETITAAVAAAEASATTAGRPVAVTYHTRRRDFVVFSMICERWTAPT